MRVPPSPAIVHALSTAFSHVTDGHIDQDVTRGRPSMRASDREHAVQRCPESSSRQPGFMLGIRCLGLLGYNAMTMTKTETVRRRTCGFTATIVQVLVTNRPLAPNGRVRYQWKVARSEGP